MTARIEELPAMRVAYIHHTGPYHEITDAFAILMEWAMLAGVDVADEQVLALSDDRPGSGSSVTERYDAGITVKDDIGGTATVGIETTEAGSYVVVEHVGSYDTLSQAYVQAAEDAASDGWVPRSGPALEFFENDPSEVSIDELRTWVYLPVTKSAT